MIIVLRGDFDPPRTKRVLEQVNEVTTPEHDSTITAKKEGYYRLTFNDKGEVSNEALIGPPDIWFSPLLDGLSLTDFPDGFSFGNGNSGPVFIRRRDGENVCITWCVLPEGGTLDDCHLYSMQEIHEGIPPGNPERRV